MSEKINVKELVNTELASTYGGWLYCGSCHTNIGYLCYVTYSSVQLEYCCNCGSTGSIQIEKEDLPPMKHTDHDMIIIKNRLCCSEDQSPLITILDKKLKEYKLEITCKECGTHYEQKK